MEVIIDFGTGWACSNEADQTIETEIIRNEKGERQSKRTNVVRVMKYMNVEGVMTKDSEVEFAYKDHEGKHGFKGKIRGFTPEMVILEAIEEIDYKSITQKIKRRI